MDAKRLCVMNRKNIDIRVDKTYKQLKLRVSFATNNQHKRIKITTEDGRQIVCEQQNLASSQENVSSYKLDFHSFRRV